MIQTARTVEPIAAPAFARPGFARLLLTTVLAAGMLAGCGTTAPRPGKFARNAEQALQGGQADKAVALAEQAVAFDGRNAGYRLLLGNAYLRAGRFESARAAYDDAMELGEDGGKAALSLALTQVALGRGTEAVDTLNTYSDSIPAPDLGLALALAGQTGRGAKLLSDVLRNGENTAKVRQNLALAYALDGSWREASIMAAQDVPADKLDARLKSWAEMAGPEQARLRVATLLGTPVRNDPGQPAVLALANFPAQSQAATATAGGTPAAVPASEESGHDIDQGKAGALAKAAVRELPALSKASVAAPVVADASSQAPRAQLAAIDIPPAQTSFVSHGIIGTTKAPVRSPQPGERAFTVVAHAVVQPVAAAPERSTHVAQLGAFATPGGARRAWRHFVARDPGLAAYRSVITRATVHGREFWRVQAAGFASAAPARGLCGSIRARGGACMVLASVTFKAPMRAPAGAPSVATPVAARFARNR